MNSTPPPGPAGRSLVVGEALVDVVHRPDGSVEEHVGGSPANVALGLGRLGRRSDLLTWIGPDAYGELIRKHLAASGVTVLAGSTAPDRTPVATAHVDETGGATYTFELEWDLPPTWEEDGEDPLVVHTGSIASWFAPGAERVREVLAARRERSTVTFDPNLRPSLMGTPAEAVPVVEALVSESDVVKVSDEDLAWLMPGIAPAEIAEQWARTGPSLVVVTHGGEGAFATTSAGARLSVPALPVTVADTVGAGDSFMAGLIDGLWSAGLLGHDRRDALRDVETGVVEQILTRCVRISGITVSRPGANPPDRSELGEA